MKKFINKKKHGKSNYNFNLRVTLKNRRLQNWGGVPHHEGMIPEDFPKHFQDLAELLEKTFQFSKRDIVFNQVLLNEYSNGKGISFHKDGPLYKPLAAVLSLKSSAMIEFRKERDSETLISCFLKPRSLLIFEQDKFTDVFHGIRDLEKDTIEKHCLNSKDVGQSFDRGQIRLSLTIRSAVHIKEKLYTEESKKELERRKIWWLNSINEKN